VPADDENPGMAWLLFSPSGRIGRRPYLLAILFWALLPGIAVSQMFVNEHHELGLALWTLALMTIGLVSMVSLIMLSIKRVHDMGYPAIAAFLLFVPVVSFLALAAFLLWPSAGPNDFGEFTNRPK
jgi:uncharacterized membrane protein YhaH (DUF805 family)